MNFNYLCVESGDRDGKYQYDFSKAKETVFDKPN